MDMVKVFQWIVWIVGASVFAGLIGLLIRAVARASRRPVPLHSAAERIHREATLPASVDARLRELSDLKERGVIGEAEYERQRHEALHAH